MQSGPVPYTDFAVHVAPTAEDGTDVTIYGELDLATVEQVRSAFSQAVAARGPVVVDLRACGFVDSRGIAAVIELALRLREQGRRLVLRGLKPRVVRTFQIAGLAESDLLEIEPEPKPDTA
jgi:anti-sigma B factor antagonist